MSAALAPAITETEPRMRLWTRGEFDRMLALDVFPPDEDVELYDGQIYLPDQEHSRLWNRDEYHRLADTSILGADERLELLEGEIIENVTNNPPQATAVGKTVDEIRRVFAAGFIVREQHPLDVSLCSEPEPDVLVAPGKRDDYADHHPTPAEAVLVVEVSDTSLRTDRGRKTGIYAKAGCPEYWIVNVTHRQLEVHRSPSAFGYADVQIYATGQTVSPLAASDVSIAVSDLLPSRPDTRSLGVRTKP
ncbi:MAG: Uma2 family endonuclease [Armatimonadota bacterium]|nr:Uma2 family endonuclease [Armatimonadota bacterium]